MYNYLHHVYSCRLIFNQFNLNLLPFKRYRALIDKDKNVFINILASDVCLYVYL